MADGGDEFKLAARRETEFDLILDRARHPSIRRDAGNHGETHAGNTADHVENSRNGGNARYGENITIGVQSYFLDCSVSRARLTKGSNGDGVRDRGTGHKPTQGADWLPISRFYPQRSVIRPTRLIVGITAIVGAIGALANRPKAIGGP